MPFPIRNVGRPQAPALPKQIVPGESLEFDMPPGDPFWGDSYASQNQRASVMGADARSRAMQGLREAANFKREMGVEDILSGDYDLEYRAPQRMGLQEDLADMGARRSVPRADLLSEAGAARAFLPGASALHGRERRETGEDIFGRYVVPAQTQAEGELDAAGITAEGRTNAASLQAQAQVAAAQRKAMLEGLNNAIRAFIAKKGRAPQPQEVEAIRQSLGTLR